VYVARDWRCRGEYLVKEGRKEERKKERKKENERIGRPENVHNK